MPSTNHDRYFTSTRNLWIWAIFSCMWRLEQRTGQRCQNSMRCTSSSESRFKLCYSRDTSLHYMTHLAGLAHHCCQRQEAGQRLQEQALGHSDPADHLAGPAGAPALLPPAHLAAHWMLCLVNTHFAFSSNLRPCSTQTVDYTCVVHHQLHGWWYLLPCSSQSSSVVLTFAIHSAAL